MSAKDRIEKGRVKLEETLREKLVGRRIEGVIVLAPEQHSDYIAKVLLKLDDDIFSELLILCPDPDLIKDT